jgi:diadenosine tetraphosphate (Ap4A) HIT family hydrolase
MSPAEPDAMNPDPDCELCRSTGGIELFRDDVLRVVRVLDPRFPAFLRVILLAHVREMTDLPEPVAIRVFRSVLACERVLRKSAAAFKINLASLGNMTPHVHWHIIGRYPTDSHFPDAIWAPPQRATEARVALPPDDALSAALHAELATTRMGRD